MFPTTFETACDLLRMASLALAAQGFEKMAENLLRIALELVEDDTNRHQPWSAPPN